VVHLRARPHLERGLQRRLRGERDPPWVEAVRVLSGFRLSCSHRFYWKDLDMDDMLRGQKGECRHHSDTTGDETCANR
jgi:hypothetical protein